MLRKCYYLNLKIEEDRKKYEEVINNVNIEMLNFESSFTGNGDYFICFTTQEILGEEKKDSEEE